MPSADGRRQILNVGKLSALRGICEVFRQRRKLRSFGAVSVLVGSGSRRLQVGGNLLCRLLVLSGVRLFQLLESAQQLSEWGTLAAGAAYAVSGALG